MSTLLNEVRKEIVDLHAFFVEWLNGTADRNTLDSQLVARLSPGMVFIPPEGHLLSGADVISGFREAHGSNPDFRIQIRDVEICHELSEHVLATYSEWQVGSTTPGAADNARRSVALMTKSQPIEWLHVQETWLPEEMPNAGSFDF